MAIKSTRLSKKRLGRHKNTRGLKITTFVKIALKMQKLLVGHKKY